MSVAITRYEYCVYLDKVNKDSQINKNVFSQLYTESIFMSTPTKSFCIENDTGIECRFPV